MILSCIQKTDRYLWGFSTVFLFLAFVLGIWSLSIAKNYASNQYEYDDNRHILVLDTFKLRTENITYSYAIEPTIKFSTVWISITATGVILFSLFSFPYYSICNWTHIQVNRVRRSSIYFILLIFITNMVYFVIPLRNTSETASYYAVNNVKVSHNNMSVNRYFGGQMLTLFTKRISFSEARTICELNFDFHIHDMNSEGDHTIDHTFGSCVYAPEEMYLQLSYHVHPTYDCNEALWGPYRRTSGWATVLAVIEIIILIAWLFVHEQENEIFIKEFKEEQRREVEGSRAIADVETLTLK